LAVPHERYFCAKNLFDMTSKAYPKRIPYGMMNFVDVREDNCYYVDKTRFIEKIERAHRFFFYIRPRRFGKSLTMSMLRHYYDVLEADKFEQWYSYLLDTYKEVDLQFESYEKSELSSRLAYRGDWLAYFGYIADCLRRYASQRDRQKVVCEEVLLEVNTLGDYLAALGIS